MMRRVFKEFKVLVAADQANSSGYEELLKPLGFGRVECVDDERQVVGLIKKMNPDLVMVAPEFSISPGPSWIEAARAFEAVAKTPFLLLANQEHGPSEVEARVAEGPLAKIVSSGLEKDEFCRAVVEFLEPLIDPDKEKAYELADEARRKAEAGDQTEAEKIYCQALELYDHHLDSWLGLAGLLTQQDRLDEAENAFLKALEVNSYSFEAYFELADLYERHQNFEQAIGILLQALALAERIKGANKSVSKINFFIGEFELRLKRLTDAEKSFDQAIEANPEDPELRSAIGDAYAEKGYHAESEKHYQAALEMDPDLAHVLNKLGMAYRRQKKYDKALALYDNARGHHPDDEHLLFNMARTHFEAGRQSEAERLLEEALIMSPEFNEAKLLLGKLRSSREKVELDAPTEEQPPPAEPAPPAESDR